ncbi:hypothetical protein ACOSP7_014567 [Xanthoceras sorbifolium]
MYSFANDSLLFLKANHNECTTIIHILQVYESVLGQAVNLSKSAICCSSGSSAQFEDSLTSVLGVPLVDCHERYLGLPSFVGKGKRHLFQSIVDKVWGKLQG